MTERTIPEDVWERARELRQKVLWQSNASVEHIARAIMAERERCARIADAHSECERDCGDVIAAAIRGDRNG